MEFNYTIIWSVLFGLVIGLIVAYLVVGHLALKAFEFIRKNAEIKKHIAIVILQAQAPLQRFIQENFNLSSKNSEAVTKGILQVISNQIKGS